MAFLTITNCNSELLANYNIEQSGQTPLLVSVTGNNQTRSFATVNPKQRFSSLISHSVSNWSRRHSPDEGILRRRDDRTTKFLAWALRTLSDEVADEASQHKSDCQSEEVTTNQE